MRLAPGRKWGRTCGADVCDVAGVFKVDLEVVQRVCLLPVAALLSIENSVVADPHSAGQIRPPEGAVAHAFDELGGLVLQTRQGCVKVPERLERAGPLRLVQVEQSDVVVPTHPECELHEEQRRPVSSAQTRDRRSL